MPTCDNKQFWNVMGGYFSGGKKEEKPGKDHRDGQSFGEKKKWRYRVVYTDREVKMCELPRNLRAMFVLKRSG